MSADLIESIDVGDSVQCDLCSKEYKGSDAKGGFLFMSKGVCPECAPKFEADCRNYGEEGFIRARCPPQMTFHAWIMQIRGGDNTVRVYQL